MLSWRGRNWESRLIVVVFYIMLLASLLLLAIVAVVVVVALRSEGPGWLLFPLRAIVL